MLSVLVIVAATGSALLAGVVLWWATGRSPAWAMAAGAVLAMVALAAAVLIGLALTRVGP